MKKILFATLLMTGISLAGFSQNTTPANEQLDPQVAKNLEKVAAASRTAGLSDSEIEKVKTVILNLEKKKAEIKADACLTTEEKEAKMKEANAEKDRKIKNIMGDRYQAYVEERKKQNQAAKQQ